jgi:protein-tyrosine phosphatase
MQTDRTLSLKGACNFRDLGGYKTQDGRQLRQGILFRSGVLSYFKPSDMQVLSRLGIKTICDLRSSDEREKEPTEFPKEANILSWDMENSVADAIKKSGWEAPESARHAHEILLSSYQSIPYWLVPHLQGLFQCLATERVPLLFHCSAGKDRTGIVAAIVLHFLGVPREAILEDYELTNTAVDLEAFILENSRSKLGLANEVNPIYALSDDIKKVMLSADREFLLAALAKIESDNGSIDNFVKKILKVDDTDKNKIREIVLVG